MNFHLTSPEMFDLDSYQQTLKRIILVLANSSTSSSFSKSNDFQAVAGASSTTEVHLGSGGTLILDTSVTVPGFSGGTTSIRLTSSQNYPLSFIATSQLPVLLPTPLPASEQPSSINPVAVQASSSAPYFIRLPLNPHTHGIQCELSARRLCSKHVALLDRILRRLCDASPGAFMVGYSDGLSGVDAGTEVVYSGENSSYQSLHLRPQHHRIRSLDQSIAAARDRGNTDIDNHVTSLVGHVEHPTHNITSDRKEAISAKTVKSLKNELGLIVESTTVATQGQSRPLITSRQVDQVDSLAIEEYEGIVNYDFGLQEDIDQLTDVHIMVEIDELHDILWVN
ncbi:hypothetical protein BGX27_005716 [Mortierella sp. AM989]|nr:hypothetical protein BGX27_005716 [Mortierella sp. AM989]